MLPVLTAPEFEATIPSTSQQIKFRPFLVKEEKILYMAMESDDPKDMQKAVSNILRACIIDDIDVNRLSSFDIEYMFLMLRAKSVGEVIKIKVHHKDTEACPEINEVEINVDDVKMRTDEGHTKKIQITDDIGLVMKYPSLSMDTELVLSDNIENVMQLVTSCIETVWNGDEVIDLFEKEDLRRFVESFNKDQFAKVIDFFKTMPRLSHTIDYTCKTCGKEEQIVLEGLQSFFQ